MIQIIKLGERSCLLAKKHCIPFDQIVHIEFVWEDDNNILYAHITTLTKESGHTLPAAEALELNELLKR